MDFNQVTYDASLDDMDAEELRAIVKEFEAAQEGNIAEFKTAQNKIDNLDSEVEEKREFKGRLAARLEEVSPLSEGEAMTYDLARVEELIEEFSEDEDEIDDTPTASSQKTTFGDMGTKSETQDEDEAKKDFGEEHLGDMPGVNIE